MPELPPSVRGTDFPALHGAPGLTQSHYGARGNIELVAPDPRDGLWVFWHNTDPETETPGAAPVPGPPPGCWSGGLHFAAGHRFETAAVLQSRNGPDHLELLAREGGTLHRFRWSPEPGFTHEGVLPVRAAGAAGLAEGADGTVHAAVPLADGGVAHLTADPGGYPTLDWRLRRIVAEDARVLAAAAVVTPAPPHPVHLVLCTADEVRHEPAAAHGPRLPRLTGTDFTGVCAVADGSGLRCFAVTRDGMLLSADTEGSTDGSTDGNREPAFPLPGEGPVRGVAATGVTYAPGRTELAVQRGHRIIRLTREDGTAPPWHARLARSHVVPDPAAPDAPVHRRT